MAFDPTTATPVGSEFDPSSATPLGTPSPSTTPTIFDPTAGMSTTQKVLAGIGKGMVDTGRGAYQLGASIGHAAGLVSDQKMAQIQQSVDKSRELDQSLVHTTAGKVGDVIGQAAPAVLMPEAGILGSAAEGALLSAAQPIGSGQSRLQNTAMGALGGGAGATAGKLVSGLLGGLGGAGSRQEAVDLLTKEGIPLSAAQETGSKLAQTVERASSITSGEPAEFAGKQAAAFNRAVLRRIGVDDPEVAAATPDVLGPAKDAITAKMDAVASRTQPRLDDVFLNGLSDVEQNASRQLPKSDISPITQNISDILENASQNNGVLDGGFVQKLNTNLGALSRNPTTAPIASDLQDVVNDAVHRYATPGDAEILTGARQQYRALKQIEGAVDPATGNISVPKLMTSLNAKAFGGRNQTLYGTGDQSLINLAKAAKAIIPDNLGNSGTAERLLPLTTLEIAAAGEPWRAVKMAAATKAVNAAGKAMRNQGVIGKLVKNGIPAASVAAPMISRLAAPSGIGAAESEANSDAPKYAAGGKVPTHEQLVSKLMDRWHAARKHATKTTEPLLHMPDATIARALEITSRPPV